MSAEENTKHDENLNTDRPEQSSRSLTSHDPSGGRQVALDLATLRRNAMIAEARFTSHRKVLGRPVTLLKRGLRKLLAPLLQGQTAYNAANARLMFDVYEQFEILGRQIERLRTLPTTPVERAIEAPPPNRAIHSRYEAGWETYAESWESSIRTGGIQHLGDEWGSSQLVGTIIDHYVKPHLRPESTVLEIGCGGGKFSERLAPLCRSLTCADVSENMLERTKQRCRELGNVRFEKLNGVDLHQFASESIDFVFSFDVFVHIEIEDIYGYLGEIRRVLTPAGIGLMHFANLNSDEGWNKFTTEVPMNRGALKQFDRFCFLTWEIVEKLCASFAFRILKSKREPWRDILVVIEKLPAP